MMEDVDEVDDDDDDDDDSGAREKPVPIACQPARSKDLSTARPRRPVAGEAWRSASLIPLDGGRKLRVYLP
jgi:hypothetical protein